jgi:hypothetical protein
LRASQIVASYAYLRLGQHARLAHVQFLALSAGGCCLWPPCLRLRPVLPLSRPLPSVARQDETRLCNTAHVSYRDRALQHCPVQAGGGRPVSLSIFAGWRLERGEYELLALARVCARHQQTGIRPVRFPDLKTHSIPPWSRTRHTFVTRHRREMTRQRGGAVPFRADAVRWCQALGRGCVDPLPAPLTHPCETLAPTPLCRSCAPQRPLSRR